MGKIRNFFRNQKEVDFILILLVTILVTFGVVMVFSASYYDSIYLDGTPYSYLKKQAFFAFTGFIIMMGVSYIDYHKICRWAYIIAAAAVVLLILVKFTPLGEEINGAKRWIPIPVIHFTLMPGEIAKPAVIILASTLLTKNTEEIKSFKGVAPVGIYTAIVCILILIQPNLSTAITVGAIGVGIAFIAGMQWRYMAGILAVLLAGIYYIVFETDGYQHDRMVSFVDPFKYADGVGLQGSQSLLALGTGGLRGAGLGMSIRKNLYLPEPQNDFILSIIGEELGFIGILILMAVFAVLVWRLFMIAVQSKDRLGMLLASGIATMIGIQVVFNIGIVSSSLPPTGVALPFISYGGNAIWIMMGLMGMALNVSRQMIREPSKKKGAAKSTASSGSRRERTSGIRGERRAEA